MISENIKKQIFEAMKAKDEVRLSTLKMLSAALTNAEIAKKREKLTEEEELKVVQSEAKKRKDAIDAYKKAGQTERAKREEEELKILQEFLPEEISDEELTKIVSDSIEQTGASGRADVGKVMGVAMKKVAGRAAGDRVAKIVAEKLS